MDLLAPTRRSHNTALPLHTEAVYILPGGPLGGLPSLSLTTNGSWIHLWKEGRQTSRQLSDARTSRRPMNDRIGHHLRRKYWCRSAQNADSYTLPHKLYYVFIPSWIYIKSWNMTDIEPWMNRVPLSRSLKRPLLKSSGVLSALCHVIVGRGLPSAVQRSDMFLRTSTPRLWGPSMITAGAAIFTVQTKQTQHNTIQYWFNKSR